jgi:hypothetical protein
MEKGPEYLRAFCERILSLHNTIRFAGLADYGGRLVASSYRAGLVPLIDKAQTERYALQTVFRARSRGEFKPQVGENKYSIAVYERLIRSTIPITHGSEDFRSMYLLVSLDVGGHCMKVIEEMILPFISESKDALFAKTRAISDEYSQT